MFAICFRTTTPDSSRKTRKYGPVLTGNFDPKSHEAIFLGYSAQKKGFIAQVLLTGKIAESEFLYFDETSMPGLEAKSPGWFEKAFRQVDPPEMMNGTCHR